MKGKRRHLAGLVRRAFSHHALVLLCPTPLHGEPISLGQRHDESALRSATHTLGSTALCVGHRTVVVLVRVVLYCSAEGPCWKEMHIVRHRALFKRDLDHQNPEENMIMT